jgi:hypothetical protein
MLVAKQQKVPEEHRNIVKEHRVVRIGSLLSLVILVLGSAYEPIKN